MPNISHSTALLIILLIFNQQWRNFQTPQPVSTQFWQQKDSLHYSPIKSKLQRGPRNVWEGKSLKIMENVIFAVCASFPWRTNFMFELILRKECAWQASTTKKRFFFGQTYFFILLVCERVHTKTHDNLCVCIFGIILS